MKQIKLYAHPIFLILGMLIAAGGLSACGGNGGTTTTPTGAGVSGSGA